MPTESMTPRERWLAVLKRQQPDRVPLDYRATDEATCRLKQHLGCATDWEVFERLHVDKLVPIGPRYTGPLLRPGFDIYGIGYQDVDYGAGVYSEAIYHPLACYSTAEEIERHYTWPCADWFDFSVLPNLVEVRERYPIAGGGSEPFLTYKDLRGAEQAYLDLVLNPELVHYCLERLFQFCYDCTLRIYEQIPGQVLITSVSEDLGSQAGLLISPQMIGEFLLPRMQRMMDLVHQAGAYVLFHSDGAIRGILHPMIEAGIDVLDPIQWRCPGMDRASLKRDFGGRLVFHGAMDNQQTLAFGTAQDVRAEVRYNIEVLGAGGGYILAPCHNIQPISPPEHVVAMYEAAYEYGWQE